MKFLIEYFDSNTGNNTATKIQASSSEEALGKWEELTEWQFQFPKIKEYKEQIIQPKPIEELTEKQKLQKRIKNLKDAERAAYLDEDGKLEMELFYERLKLENDLSKM